MKKLIENNGPNIGLLRTLMSLLVGLIGSLLTLCLLLSEFGAVFDFSEIELEKCFSQNAERTRLDFERLHCKINQINIKSTNTS